ncbi:MAG TPA: hypothetical protein DCO82_02190 [Alphaproteobacteria bacterium]|nr:hypothetical protein [Alphaproteobacteria bacterium]
MAVFGGEAEQNDVCDITIFRVLPLAQAQDASDRKYSFPRRRRVCMGKQVHVRGNAKDRHCI